MLGILLLSPEFVYLFGFLICDTSDHEHNHCIGHILTVFIIVAVRRVDWILHVVEFVLGYLFQNTSRKPWLVLLKHVLNIFTKDGVKEILGLVNHRAILKQAASSFGFTCKVYKGVNLFEGWSREVVMSGQELFELRDLFGIFISKGVECCDSESLILISFCFLNNALNSLEVLIFTIWATYDILLYFRRLI